MKLSSLVIFQIICKLYTTKAENDNPQKQCQRLNEKCLVTDDCCLGTCVQGFCNDGLFKNSKDRSVAASDKAFLIAAELATGSQVDVSEHPNLKLLPTLEECGESVSSTAKRRRRKRIVGGLPFELGKYPWTVSIHLNNITDTDNQSGFHCGASLISRRHVITAAHCVTRLSAGVMLKWLTLGNVDRRHKLDCENKSRDDEACSESKYVDMEIEEWVVHEGYSESNVRNDIALIKMKQEVNFTDDIGPICLPRNEKAFRNWPDSELTVVGWGTQNSPYDTNPSQLSLIAQEVEMNLVHRSNCDRYFTHMIGRLRRSQICAGGYPGKGDCSGDSGGPLFKRIPIDIDSDSEPVDLYTLVGIVSTGAVVQCGREGMPSVFTNVLFYMPWILDHLVSKPKVFSDKMYRDAVKPEDEFATGFNPRMDVRKHSNIRLLPKFPSCGSRFVPNASSSHIKRVKRVVGGVTQAVGAMPWIVQLYVRHAETGELSLRCGGVLISKRYVLTGSHCIADIRGPYVLDGVVVGNTNRKLPYECIGRECMEMKLIPIEDSITHEDFSKYSREYDVALIRMAYEVEFNKFVQPACLPLTESIVTKAWPNPSKDVKYIMAGWGRVTQDSNENTISNFLASVTLNLESKKFCESSLVRKIGKLENKRVCGGGSTSGKGECVGDTGAPMLRWVTQTDAEGKSYSRIYVFGVLSNVECGNPGIPSIYQNVLYFMPWILDNMEE